jgi:hypothetical protein
MTPSLSRRTASRCLIVLAVVCGTLALGPSHPVSAVTLCGAEVIFYYSDPGLTHTVGHCTADCVTGRQTCYGQQTRYTQEDSTCHFC